MTAVLQIATITAAIADVTITGLTISDFAGIPEQVDTRATAQLFPDPDVFVTELVVTNATHGYNTAAKNADYKLNYVLAYKNIEAGRRFSDHIPAMVTMLGDIIETLTTTDFSAAGALHFDISVPFMGKIIDPAGNAFLGAKIIIDVMEFIQG